MADHNAHICPEPDLHVAYSMHYLKEGLKVYQPQLCDIFAVHISVQVCFNTFHSMDSFVSIPQQNRVIVAYLHSITWQNSTCGLPKLGES